MEAVWENLTVRPVVGSRLVDVSYSDPDPARAQRVANAYADAYIASNLDKRFPGQRLRQDLPRGPDPAAEAAA